MRGMREMANHCCSARNRETSPFSSSTGPQPSGEHEGPARQRCHAHAPASCPGRRLQLLAPAAALVLAQPAVGEALVVASELRTKFGASRLHSSRARSCCHTSASRVSLRLCAVAKATYRFLLARAAHLSVHDVVDPALGVAHHLDAIPWRVPSEKTALATLIDVEITAVATARRTALQNLCAFELRTWTFLD